MDSRTRLCARGELMADDVDVGLMTAAELDTSVAISGNGVHVEHVLEGGEVLDLGDGLELEIHFTPGHTAGHICVLDRSNCVLV